MNKVFLYGGINSKLKHYKYAIEVYEAHKFKVDFIQSRYNGASTFLPNVYRKQNELLKYEDVNKCIIHTSSGGFWAGLEFNKTRRADSFIMENGPLLATPEQFIHTTQKIYKIKYPELFVKNMHVLMNGIGIPTPHFTPEFYTNIDSLTTEIQNCLLINGNQDSFVNHEYIKEYVNQLKKLGKDVDSIYFMDGTHTKVHKNNIQAYQDAIEKKIKSII
jgi:hypothetical protein